MRDKDGTEYTPYVPGPWRHLPKAGSRLEILSPWRAVAEKREV